MNKKKTKTNEKKQNQILLSQPNNITNHFLSYFLLLFPSSSKSPQPPLKINSKCRSVTSFYLLVGEWGIPISSRVDNISSLMTIDSHQDLLAPYLFRYPIVHSRVIIFSIHNQVGERNRARFRQLTYNELSFNGFNRLCRLSYLRRPQLVFHTK